MVRRSSLLFASLGFLVVFILITNYLLVTLPNSEIIVQSRTLTIEEKIYQELKTLPAHYKLKPLVVDKSVDIFIKNIRKTELSVNDTTLKNIWNLTNTWVTKTQVVSLSSSSIGQVVTALKTARVIKADLDIRGTQLKFLLTLQGEQEVIFKPQWYPKDHIIEGPVYAGKDRYGSEIIGFYLSAILRKPLTPISVERKISLKKEILPVATKRLLETKFERYNKTCVYGKCFYCKKEDPICENMTASLNGAVIFNFKGSLTNHRSPWQRTYKKGKMAAWQEFPDTFCRSVREKLPKKRIYDLIDVSIFDFLLQNGDRHHYETIGDTVIWLDNGKGLGNPNIHHIDILAPLYQCCILRRDTWKTLLGLTGGKLREKLEMMPDVKNLITENHLRAIEERLLLIFATIEYCRHLKQNEHYLL